MNSAHSDPSTGPTTTATSSGLFARNATGLVREVTPLSAYLLNSIGGHPVQPLAFGLFFAFALFPGGSFLVGGLLALPLVLAFSYAFGLMTALIPRSGGDYTIVTRIISPLIGLISSCCQTVANLLSVAFFGSVIVTLGVGPGLIGSGLIMHNQAWIDAGTIIQNGPIWKIIIGTAMYLLAAAMHMGGWRRVARVQAVVWTIVTAGLVICGLIALFTPTSVFINNFNTFAQPYTGNADTYHAVIATAQKAGVQTNAPFSFGNTIPIIGIFAQFSIFSWFTSYIGGEIRQGRSTKTAHMMAFGGITSVLGVLLFAAIFFRTFGTDFLVAANASTGLPSSIPTAPVYFFLIAVSVGSPVVAMLLVATYLLFWVMLTYFVFTQPTRTLFAWSFDGILPQKVTAVSERSHTPVVALIITVVLAEIFLIYSLTNAAFYQVIVYATLIQLISMGLVGVAAMIVPWRRPALYNASSTKRTFLGLPVIAWVGAGAVASAIFIWVLYFVYADQYALNDKTGLFSWIGGTILFALLYYYGARWYKQRFERVDLSQTYGEIPPE